jgi:quinol monooxygenase YgiN
MAYALLNKLTAKPGRRDDVVKILIESAKMFDDNDACLMYLVGEAVDDPNVIWVTDLWTSGEEHAAALKAPELRPYVERAMPMLEGMPEQLEVRPRGGKAAGLYDSRLPGGGST